MAESQDDYNARIEQKIAHLPQQENGRFQRLLERQGRAAPAAPMHEVHQLNTSMFVRMQPPERLGRANLAVFIKRFRIWTCYHRCDEALETETIFRTSEVTRSILEEIHGKQLVAQSYMVWEALNKTVEKDDVILNTW